MKNSKNRKTYLLRYDSYEFYYKSLKKNGNMKYLNTLKKGYDDFIEIKKSNKY